MTNKKHNYDWGAMGFNPDDGDVEFAFAWIQTPQGHQWWLDNNDTPEGQAEFARMKRLYAEDMDAKEGPVRTVTKKEIVPGVYGAVEIYDGQSGRVGIKWHGFTSRDELTAAIETLTQIRDALEK